MEAALTLVTGQLYGLKYGAYVLRLFAASRRRARDRRADRGLTSNGPAGVAGGHKPARTGPPFCVYLARFQTISSTPAGAVGLMNRISSAVIDVTIRL